MGTHKTCLISRSKYQNSPHYGVQPTPKISFIPTCSFRDGTYLPTSYPAYVYICVCVLRVFVCRLRHDLMSPTIPKRPQHDRPEHHRRTKSEPIGWTWSVDRAVAPPRSPRNPKPSSQSIHFSLSGACSSTPTGTTPVTATFSTVSGSGATTLSSSSNHKTGRQEDEQQERPPDRPIGGLHNAGTGVPLPYGCLKFADEQHI